MRLQILEAGSHRSERVDKTTQSRSFCETSVGLRASSAHLVVARSPRVSRLVYAASSAATMRKANLGLAQERVDLEGDCSDNAAFERLGRGTWMLGAAKAKPVVARSLFVNPTPVRHLFRPVLVGRLLCRVLCRVRL